VWYTAFSYFGSINNLYLVSRGKTQWVAVLTLTGAILNVALNALLIPVLEIRGAALASLASQFAANFLLLLCIPALREAFFLQVQGIALLGFVPPNKHGPS
jgi:Na+-driven multidrug efflux pump